MNASRRMIGLNHRSLLPLLVGLGCATGCTLHTPQSATYGSSTQENTLDSETVSVRVDTEGASMVSLSNPLAVESQLVYDEQGRLTAVVSPGPEDPPVVTEYDEHGNRVETHLAGIKE